MWKSLFIGFISFPLSFLAFLIGSTALGFKGGVITGLSVLALGFVVATGVLLTTRRLSTVDLFLPIPAAVLWSAILTVLSVGGNLFTAPSCIGSAILLSVCLWMIRSGRLAKTWAIVPVTIFIYEMLPVNIPGPFDDYFSFGGDAAVVLLQGIVLSLRKDRDRLAAPPPVKELNS